MGNQGLAPGADAIEESSYSVISYPGKSLPQQYESLVHSKWKRSLRYGNEYFKLTYDRSYFEAYERYINRLLARPDSIMRLAVLTEDHDVCLGWSLIEGDTLHYVFVQHEHRNQGIGKSLVPCKINWITHLTRAGMSAWHNKLPEAKFDPFR